jgi:hypothetical protein
MSRRKRLDDMDAPHVHENDDDVDCQFFGFKPPSSDLNVLRRKSTKRLAFSNFDRLIFAGLYRIAPNVLDALVIVKPETVIGWHSAGFRLFWRWKSRSCGGRPKVPLEIRQLIRDMSLANPLYRAAIAMAECPYGTADWLDPAGMS